ncbi:hypothetical protein Q3G72_029663 [Acer saccharum]|nr:hypothetical protein Q3G72_029663 [Acer saccharum]
MEKEERNQRACKSSSMESEFLLQWGNKKRLRCVRVKDPQKFSDNSNGVIRRKITSRIDRCLVTASDKEASNRLTSCLGNADEYIDWTIHWKSSTDSDQGHQFFC